MLLSKEEAIKRKYKKYKSPEFMNASELYQKCFWYKGLDGVNRKNYYVNHYYYAPENGLTESWESELDFVKLDESGKSHTFRVKLLNSTDIDFAEQAFSDIFIKMGAIPKEEDDSVVGEA